MVVTILIAVSYYVLVACILVGILKIVDILQFWIVNNNPRVKELGYHRDLSDDESLIQVGIMWPIFIVPLILVALYEVVRGLAKLVCKIFHTPTKIKSAQEYRLMCQNFDSWWNDEL